MKCFVSTQGDPNLNRYEFVKGKFIFEALYETTHFFFRYVGSTLKSKGLQLGRITGLDPAEPHFEHTHHKVR